MALALNYQTAAQFADKFWLRVRKTYQRGDKQEFARLIWWVWNHVQLGDLTTDQVRSSYNAAYGKSLNTSQWNNFVTNTLVPIKDRYLAMLNQGDIG